MKSRISKSDAPSAPLPLGTNAVVLGRKGSGKTTLVKRLLSQHSRALIVDPLREYADVAVEVAAADDLADYLDGAGARWKVAYHNDRLNDDFPGLCRTAYRLGGLLFVVEEADWFCTPSDIPFDFERVLKYGRHTETHVLAVSRRAAEIHRMLTSQAWELYVFCTAEPRDLDYMAKITSSDFAAGLERLPPHHYRRINLLDRAEPWGEHTGDGSTLPAPAAGGKEESDEKDRIAAD